MIELQSLSLDTNLLSLGAILGTSGSSELISNINQRCGSGSFFGSMEDPFRTGYQAFMTKIVEPIRHVQQTLFSTAKSLFHKDVYRPIDSRKELEKGIPPCMQLGIVYYAPIRRMLEEESIDGFGIDIKTLREDDPFESVLNSDYVELHSDVLRGKGDFDMFHYEYSDSPELSDDEISALRKTREYIDRFIVDDETQCFDFTSFPDLHS